MSIVAVALLTIGLHVHPGLDRSTDVAAGPCCAIAVAADPHPEDVGVVGDAGLAVRDIQGGFEATASGAALPEGRPAPHFGGLLFLFHRAIRL